MTYNVHACLGLDGQLSPRRIARVVAQSGADVVALQELDVGRSRTGGIDQAHAIATALQMQHHFHAAWNVEEERYGNAVLSRFPLRLVHAGALPSTKANRETRGALWVEVDCGGVTVQVLNTHLSLYPIERKLQAKSLMSSRWVGAATPRGAMILCGDFNARPNSACCRLIAKQLKDAHDDAPGPTTATWMSVRPITRIDHVFSNDLLEVASANVIDSSLARIASDHLPLVVDFSIGKVIRTSTPPSESFSASIVPP